MLGRLRKRFMGVFDALATGFAVGERLSEGERLQALGMGLMLAAPLIFRRRFYSLAGAAAMAVVAYFFWDQIHAEQPMLEDAPPATPADPRVN